MKTLLVKIIVRLTKGFVKLKIKSFYVYLLILLCTRLDRIHVSKRKVPCIKVAINYTQYELKYDGIPQYH